MSYVFDEAGGFWKRDVYADFRYSDGAETEEELLAAVRQAADKGIFSTDLAAAIRDWPSYYHLHPARTNLMRPHEALLGNASVLELGGGCGAITRYLGENSKKVTMVEGSPRRAAIAAARCFDLENVTIYCDTIQDADLPLASFDVVTLIGVLEYARLFDQASKDPVQAMLERAKSFLKPGGKLILAIENQLGLKYFAGAPEDHLGTAMAGINDTYEEKGVVTFGAAELRRRLNRAGFVGLRQFIPLPDYKFPVVVVYPEAQGLPLDEFNLHALLRESIQSDRQQPTTNTFSMENAWGVLARNDLVWELCSSLCFVAGLERQAAELPGTPAEVCLASYYSTGRVGEFVKQASFIRSEKGIVVRRSALAPRSHTHSRLRNNFPAEEPYLPYPSYFDRLSRILNRQGWTVDQIVEWNLPLLSFWKQHTVTQAGAFYLPSRLMDSIARNILESPSGELHCIDMEWEYQDTFLPLFYVALYNLLVSFDSIHEVALPRVPVATKWELAMQVMEGMRFHLTQEEQDDFLAWVRRFHREVTGAQRADKRFKNTPLLVRYTVEEIYTQAVQQSQVAQALQNQLVEKEKQYAAVVKEKEMLVAVINKHLGKRSQHEDDSAES